MRQAPITRDRIDELLQFLPKLSAPGPQIAPEWKGLHQEPDAREFVMPYPVYPPDVQKFFQLASQPCWIDHGYAAKNAARLVRSNGAIAAARLDEIRTMLTFCVRGEHFCDGHWDAMIKDGRIGAILQRLEHLRSTVP